MVFSGGWRVFVGALVLSTGVLAPATASADPVACDTWTETGLPVPEGVDNGTTTGATAFWPDTEQRPVGVNSGARLGVLTDEGDLYGARVLDEWNSYPVVLDCV